MENNVAFNYRYSAANNREIENIRKKYLPREESKIDRLKRLDYQVQTAGMIQGLTIGIIGCLIFGTGVCFFLDVFTAAPWLTAVLMVLGTLIMLPAYPVYRRIARKTKERLAPEILKLSDEIIKNGAIRFFNISQTFYKQNTNNRVLEYNHKIKNDVNEVLGMNRNDQQFMAQKIRTQYMEKQTTELDELRELDKKVKRPANVFAYVFGSLSAIIMGSGMSLIMTDIAETIGVADPMLPGIAIGVVGMLMAIINYPIYKGILGSRKKKYADRILSLSEKIMNK